jgi:1-acyl-sn-glycerol-3-phosphate acyltransferase
VATLIPRSDRAATEAQVLAIARGLLRELGNTAAAEAVKSSAGLDRDLGLGSIERVEFLSRIEQSLGISLPESAVADALTLDDIIAAAAGSRPSGTGNAVGGQAAISTSADPTRATSGSDRTNSEPRARHAAASPAFGRESSGLRRVLEFLYGIYAAATFIVWLVITWLIVLVIPPGRPAARMTSIALRLYFAVIGCRLKMEGREHVEAYGPCIYVSNHTSYADVLVIMALFPTNYHFVAKNEINHMPFIGTFLRKIGHFAFDRRKLRERSRQVERMEKALLRGESLLVFAEGTFTAEDGLRPFQLGAFRVAVKTGRPIIPVTVRGARHVLRDGTFLPKPGGITVIVSPALIVSPETEGREWAEILRLRDETRRIISSHSGEPLLPQPGTEPVENRASL